MFEKVQQMTSTMCGPPKGIVFDGYANGDIVFTQVLRVGEKGEREGGGYELGGCRLCVDRLEGDSAGAHASHSRSMPLVGVPCAPWHLSATLSRLLSLCLSLRPRSWPCNGSRSTGAGTRCLLLLLLVVVVEVEEKVPVPAVSYAVMSFSVEHHGNAA